ncbi:MAG: gfo/Idh/MocA family oxidoreductase [Actinobacteria bacterium]|nr:MAG: gfo/Idh/MocA family oxidoreductase [Actinomycetota bacterium]
MGKAHSNALKKIPYIFTPPPAVPELAAICGRDGEAVAEARRRYGYARHYTDWRAMLEDEAVDIFDDAGPNDVHAEPCIAALAAGKHVMCEKPLARSAAEAGAMLEAARAAGTKHMTAFNYRFVPAVRLAWELLRDGALGRIYHYRASYLQEWLMPALGAGDSWRLHRGAAGSGALGDLGSHAIDLAHFLVGEIAAVSAVTQDPAPHEGGRESGEGVDAAFAAAVEFAHGATGTLEATRVAAGRKNRLSFEINAETATLCFDLERLNELRIYRMDEEPETVRGFHDVLVTDPGHPWAEAWWPPGHVIGWEHTFVHEFAHFLACVAQDREIAPLGATFEDGYRCAAVCDAILASAASGRKVYVDYKL